MKKILTCAAIFAMFAGLSAQAAVQPVTPVPERVGYVTVSVTASTELTPDTAELSILIESYDSKSMQKATVANKEISEKVYAALKSMITPANGDFVKTANFTASPEYKYSGNKQVLDRYRVTNNIVIKTKSIDKVGEMIDKSIVLGAKSVNNLTFSVSKYDAECRELLAEASKKAYENAKIVVANSPSSIIGVSSMNASCNGNSSRPPVRAVYAELSKSADMMNNEVAETYTVIEAGTLKLNATVNATYYVK